MRKTFKILVSALIAVFFVGVITVMVLGAIEQHRKSGQLETWNVYQGQLDGNDVEITYTKHFGDTVGETIVELHPIGKPIYVGITGHYSGVNRRMDMERLFYCGMPDEHTGCNAVHFVGYDRYEWEPCPADEGKVKPFTMGQVKDGQQKLESAITAIYNQEHLVSTLADYLRKEKAN